MAQCTAPVEGHRTASGAAACPACRGGYGRSYRSYSAPSYPPVYRGTGGGYGSTAPPRRSGGGSWGATFSVSERATLEPVRREVVRVAQSHPEWRHLFLCHAWDDRQGAAKELYDLLRAQHVTVWFSEQDVGLGTSLLREIDKGLRMSRASIVLVTPALLKSIENAGIAERELSALLATDRVVPVAHGTTFDALRDISPLLASRSGLTSGADSPLSQIASRIAETVKVDDQTSVSNPSREW